MPFQRQHRYLAWPALGAYAIAVLAGVLALLVTQAYRAGFSGADEPAHFLNGYFISNYLRYHFGGNPMAFAVEYYLHYPKISIGHWPPAYYGFLGMLFLGVPPTPAMAFAVNLAVSALPAAAVGVALARLAGVRAALAGAAVYALTPLAIEGQAFFMLDQALAACCAAATIAWFAYSQRPGGLRAFLFAALCALAVLIKGNGWLIVLVPLFHMLLTRGWRLLASPRLYVAAASACSVIVPWYWFTSKISADGFNYQAGWAYALHALHLNVQTLVANLGYVGLLLALGALAAEYRARHATPVRWSIASACASLVLATLTLQSVVPADIDSRYLTPALPALAVLAFAGLAHLYAWSGRTARPVLALPVCGALALALLLPGALHVVQRVPKVDMRMAEIGAGLDGGVPRIWVIDGSSGAEGAFIAQMAVRDPALHSYVVRASKLFAASNFMGTQYRLKFADPRRALDELQRLGVQYVVLVRQDNAAPFPHSAQLSEAMALPGAPYQRVMTLAHRNRPGFTDVYALPGTVTPDIDAVRQLGLPAKAGALVQQAPR